MSPDVRTILSSIGSVGIIVIAIVFLANLKEPEIVAQQPDLTAQTANTENADSFASVAAALPSVATSAPKQVVATVKKENAPVATAPEIPADSAPRVVRIQDPYSIPPKNFVTVNDETRAALVNIFCSGKGGSLRPISASGVISNSSGMILTNAHVAQFVLLAADPRINLSCKIRTGSPARPAWIPEVVYIPPAWVYEHAADITLERPVGTGENDYALLRIAAAVDGSPLPERGFPYVLPDVREAIGFVSDIVLVASYPAEFLGGLAAQTELYPVSSVTSIQEFSTFSDKTVDAISVGGVMGAQSGSSGGAVVNAWGRLLGIISTTSEGETTAERELRAITLSYIDRDITARTGSSLSQLLASDPASLAAQFNASVAPKLRELLIEKLRN